jgi:hypothetical protein
VNFITLLSILTYVCAYESDYVGAWRQCMAAAVWCTVLLNDYQETKNKTNIEIINNQGSQVHALKNA